MATGGRHRLEELAVRELLGNRAPQPPVDVEELALSVGVDAIQEARIPEDGLLEIHGERLVVRIADQISEPRQRFAIAHELGHLWLLRERPDLLDRFDRRAVERFCNRFAAELLLPQAWVRQVAGDVVALAVLARIARNARAPCPATLLALRAYAGWDSALLYWELVGHEWNLISVTGSKEFIRSGMKTFDRFTKFALSEDLSVGAIHQDIELPLTVGEVDRLCAAELRLTSRSALALINLEKNLGDRTFAPSPRPRAAHRSFPDGMNLTERASLKSIQRLQA